MTRRRKRQAPRPVAWQAWSKAFADLFQLTPDSWTPPEQVQVRYAQRHVTFTAKFTDNDGLPVKAVVRAKRDAQGWFVSEQSLAISVKTQPERSSS